MYIKGLSSLMPDVRLSTMILLKSASQVAKTGARSGNPRIFCDFLIVTVNSTKYIVRAIRQSNNFTQDVIR
jgi:hypothetical protein